jgi:hypothetical protein
VPFWRREEPAHEKLAREGGLVPKAEPHPETRRRWHDTLVGIHGVARPREWDAVATVEATGLAAERIAFVTLPDGSLIVEEGPDGNLEPLAQAVEETLSPPYRAEAVAQDERHWAVAANRIEVLELSGTPEWAEEITLTVREDEHELLIDGQARDGTVPSLEAHAGARYPSFIAQAMRIDGDLWEVRVYAL